MNVVLERGVGRVVLEGILRGEKGERASPWAVALLAAFRGYVTWLATKVLCSPRKV